MEWIFMGTKYMGKANNTQINEQKQSLIKIVITYWSNKCVD